MVRKIKKKKDKREPVDMQSVYKHWDKLDADYVASFIIKEDDDAKEEK